jgi:hypothetical protein
VENGQSGHPHKGRHLRVHPRGLLPDQLDDLRALGEVGIGRVRDPLILGPLADHFPIDVDQQNREVTPVPEADCFSHVRGELHLVLDEGGTETLVRGQRGHVLGAVDDDQVTVVVEIALITRAQHIADEGLVRGRLVLVVAHEDARGSVRDLTILRDDDLDAGNRTAHRLGLHLVPMGRGDADLCLAVDLLQRDAEGVEVLHDVDAERGASGVDPLRAEQTQMVPQRTEHQELSDRDFDASPPACLLAVVAAFGASLPDFHPPVVDGPLQPGGLADPDLDPREIVLPHARRPEELMGAYLSDVVTQRFGSFGEVEPVALHDVARGGEVAFARPRQRQEHQPFVLRLHRLCEEEVLHACDDIEMGHHCALRLSRGPRGVHQNRDVGVLATRHALAILVRIRLGPSSTHGENLVEGDRHLGVVERHSPPIAVDDAPESRQLMLHLEELVGLLLVAHHDHRTLRVLHDEGHFLR